MGNLDCLTCSAVNKSLIRIFSRSKRYPASAPLTEYLQVPLSGLYKNLHLFQLLPRLSCECQNSYASNSNEGNLVIKYDVVTGISDEGNGDNDACTGNLV